MRRGSWIFSPTARWSAGILLVILPILFSSCAPVRRAPVFRMPARTDLSRKTAVHIVAPGETLWRIGKMYSVPVATIMRANKLNDKTCIRYGQELVIPNAAPIQPVITLYPSNKWKYIIIHHSATEEGSSLQFHKSHLSKGWNRGVGYHFVIDNGQSGKQDGEIETTPRWLKQQDGAHCKAAGMNTKGIGICLVGNFNNERVSRAQFKALIHLVNQLRYYYRIPVKNILGHGQVKGSRTDCPGKNFPWTKFKRNL